MKKFLIILSFLSLVFIPLLANVYTIDNLPNVHIVDRERYVVNPDGILSPQVEAALNSQIAQVWGTTSAEMIVVVVDDFDEGNIDDFATKLFEHWGIGKSDNNNGVLVLVAKDRREAVIRPGYGVEGILTDALCGRVLRHQMFPNFAQGDYDAGMTQAVSEISHMLTDPKYVEELKSRYGNDQQRDEGSLWDELRLPFYIILAISAIFLIIAFYRYHEGYAKGYDTMKHYKRLQAMQSPLMIFTFFGLGIPLIAYLPLLVMMSRVRNARRECPNCHARLQKLDEEKDNEYLNQVQDLEERLKSVDYDVWRCPQCGEIDTLAYENPRSNYTRCPKCGGKTMTEVSDRIVVQPTTQTAGRGERISVCQHCGNMRKKPYTIPKREDVSGAAVAGAILGGMLGSGGGGIQGPRGGSFGGGHTGGGGASGRW